MPNLYGIGEYYGIKAHNGLVIEGSTNNYMQYPYFLIPKIGSHESIAAISESGFFTFMPYSMGLTAMDKMPRTTVTVTPLLYTTASAYLKTGDFENVEKADGDMKAEFMLGALATENNTKLLWYASPFIVDESADQLVSGGNSNFFIATLNWICGEGESVSIAAKTMQVAALMLTATESNLWSVVTIAVIPLLFAGFGLYVWMKRRKR